MPSNSVPIQERVVNADNIAGNIWIKWFNTVSRSIVRIRNDGSLEMPEIADADAVNNSIYYSTTLGVLVYKDSSGVVNALY